MKSENKLIRIFKDYPLAVVCFAVILMCTAAIFLRGGTTIELTAQENDLTARIRTIDQNVKNAKDLKEEVNEVQRLVDEIQARLFNRNERAININFFYALENRLNVRISNIAQMPAGNPIYEKGGPRALKLHSTIGYSMSLNGTFEDILEFMYELHRVDRLIRVADFQVADASRNGTQNTLDARLRVIVLAENE
ncbi:hypothetical protein QEH52_14365 [Coraliomargarita sp. SDUM461003]|uniref:Pilus assembly protein PilO n=1 Tax=Thalassobacterium maritimum TaxID=3041265 RepID=A0ABU1AX29_9BACT|nr:hypothetical protein [Coraliomargarita sp. SDUM461003]MBT62130.1 hypothetical protein [Puniceicoccaceae bacterium]MDQ8208707.1 hypothetical protein [Coraliomargarita sp. SDUM461003]HBR93024.1 hypothetical protein [Opitutae bacterium]|tara:strand:- start:20375 stop:20956 length:582 start_codon:yes stop_codon:yes gene_type:complete